MAKLRRGFKTWCENVARGYRREAGLQPYDPLSPRLLAKMLGVPVWNVRDIPGLENSHVMRLTETDRDTWSAATLRDGEHSLIIVNEGHHPARQNNSICHELGHIVLKHVAPRMIVSGTQAMLMTDYDPTMEEEATVFAGAVLAPREALLKWINDGMSTIQLADHFGVSTQLIEMRKNTTGIGFQLAHRQRGTWIP